MGKSQPGVETNEGLFGPVPSVPRQPVTDRAPKVEVQPLRTTTAVVMRLNDLIKWFDALEGATLASRPPESILRAKIQEFSEAKSALRAAVALILEKKQ